MRTMFYKFLKFWKFWGSFKDTEVYGGAGRFWEKNKTLIPELSTPVTWPICDLLLSYWFFLFTICHFPFNHALGSFPMQNFPHFTLHWLRSDQAGPMGILSNRCSSYYSTIFNSSASVVCDTNSLTNSRSAKGWKEKDDSQAEKQKKTIWKMAARRMKGSSKPMGRFVVMNIKPWLGWARYGPPSRHNTNSM